MSYAAVQRLFAFQILYLVPGSLSIRTMSEVEDSVKVRNQASLKRGYILSGRAVPVPATLHTCDLMSFCRILYTYVMQSGHFSQCTAFLSQTAKERDKKYSVKSP